MSKRSGLLIAAGVAAAALAGGLAGPAAAAPLLRLPAAATTDYDRDVFFFGGRMTSAPFGQSFNPFNPWYENNFIVGGGYQQFPFRFPYDFRLGVEAGLAGRFGDGNSLEVWGGGVIRYDGFTIGDQFGNGKPAARCPPAALSEGFSLTLHASTPPRQDR